MFDHKNFTLYKYDELPLNKDCDLMQEKYMKAYEQSYLDFFKGKELKFSGYFIPISILSINENIVKIAWYVNIFERAHEVHINLPVNQIVQCVCVRKRPCLFIKDEWIFQLYRNNYSVFVLIDAMNMKNAIKANQISQEKLIKIRDEIDILANNYQNISFISFADSILLKSHWTAGSMMSTNNYTYQPEIFLKIFKEIKSIYNKYLGLNIYGIFSQGFNEFYESARLHISKTKNHVCLNSFGTPFAELFEIDKSARLEIEKSENFASELYMDELFFNSINFENTLNLSDLSTKNYTISPIEKKYYYCSYDFIDKYLKK